MRVCHCAFRSSTCPLPCRSACSASSLRASRRRSSPRPTSWRSRRAPWAPAPPTPVCSAARHSTAPGRFSWSYRFLPPASAGHLENEVHHLVVDFLPAAFLDRSRGAPLKVVSDHHSARPAKRLLGG